MLCNYNTSKKKKLKPKEETTTEKKFPFQGYINQDADICRPRLKFCKNKLLGIRNISKNFQHILFCGQSKKAICTICFAGEYSEMIDKNPQIIVLIVFQFIST